MGQCIVDSSVSCPFRSCIAGSIEACNVRSGRFSPRGSKVDYSFLKSRRFKR